MVEKFKKNNPQSPNAATWGNAAWVAIYDRFMPLTFTPTVDKVIFSPPKNYILQLTNLCCWYEFHSLSSILYSVTNSGRS